MSTEQDALKMIMLKMNLHAGLQIWIWRIYKLKGLAYTMHVLNAWTEKPKQ